MSPRSSPKRGSLQFWPRVRAKSIIPKIRSHVLSQDAKLLGFAGYKVGMIQAAFVESRKNMPAKGMDVVMPVTIVECPPLKVYGVRFYQKDPNGFLIASKDVLAENVDKILKRKVSLPKKSKSDLNSIDIKKYADLKLIVYTQPKLTNIGNKTPELFELPIGGNISQKLEYAKSIIGKEIYVSDVFKENTLVDVPGVTKGKGNQGPTKRFGLSLRHHKSEKTKRGPGTLGAWKEKGKHTWTVAHAGQMGFHLRLDYNKLLIKVMKANDAKDVNRSGGIHKYGVIQNDVLLIKGSIMGPRKRLIKVMQGVRKPNAKLLLPPSTPVQVLKNH